MRVPFIGLLVLSLVVGSRVHRTQKCLNEYRSGKVIKYGRPAIVTPDRDVYYPEDVAKFRCPAGYHFQSIYYQHHQEMWIQCLKDHHWLEDWPICRGPLENVTCENQYYTAEKRGRHWQNQTVNEFHALYTELPNYRYGMSLRFSCPSHSHLFRTKGLTVMTTQCLKDGEWSKEWPMCKGRTCKYKYVKNGIINDENKKLSVGVQLDITCKSGYYLWGANRTTCLGNLEWSGYPQECVTLNKFRKNCEMDKRVMKIRYEGYRQTPYCYYEYVEHTSNHYKIAVGISVPMVIGFIIFIVTASFYVRHQRIKMSRERASYIRQQQRHNRLLSSLPSYEDAVKSIPNQPPPTFEETFGVGVEAAESNLLLPPEDDPVADQTVTVIDLPPGYNENTQYPQEELPPEYTETDSPPHPSTSDTPPGNTESLSLSQSSDVSPESSVNQLVTDCAIDDSSTSDVLETPIVSIVNVSMHQARDFSEPHASIS